MKKTTVAILALLAVNSAFAATSVGSSAVTTAAPSATTVAAPSATTTVTPKKKAKREFHEYCSPIQYGPQFADCTPKKTAFKFLASLQQAVKTGDKQAISQMVRYPLTTNAKIKNSADFVKNYDQIFTSDVTKAILAQDPKTLFSNSQGVMIGSGQVWFTSEAMTSPGNFDNSGPALIITVNS